MPTSMLTANGADEGVRTVWTSLASGAVPEEDELSKLRMK